MKQTDIGSGYSQSVHGILAVLSLGPQSGYDIKKNLESPSMFFWQESYGNIYPILKRLFRDGLLHKHDSWVKSKKRVIYELNQSGWEALRQWLTEPVRMSRFRMELLMKIRFGGSTGTATLISHLEQYRQATLEDITGVQSLIESLGSSPGSLDDELEKITLDMLLRQKRSLLLWCDDSIRLLVRWESASAPGGPPLSPADTGEEEGRALGVPGRTAPPVD